MCLYVYTTRRAQGATHKNELEARRRAGSTLERKKNCFYPRAGDLALRGVHVLRVLLLGGISFLDANLETCILIRIGDLVGTLC